MTRRLVDAAHSHVRGSSRRVIAVSVGTLLLCLACIGTGGGLLSDSFLSRQTPQAFTGCGRSTLVQITGDLPPVGGLIEEQVRNAAIIVSVGQNMHISPRGWVIAIATALQESRLSNLPHLGQSNDHDSIGLFQQRPSQGWGSVSQLSNPEYQTRKFFSKLVKIGGWQDLPLTVAAQKVQVSAYPNAYAKHESFASRIVDALTGGASRSAISSVALRCANADDITASGWIAPVQGSVTSGFESRQDQGTTGWILPFERYGDSRSKRGSCSRFDMQCSRWASVV